MITVDRALFQRAIDLAASAVYPRNTIPVLGSLKVQANGALRIEGSDLDTFTRVEIAYSGKPSKNCDSFTLPEPRKVRSAIAAAGGGDVGIVLKSNQTELTLSAGNLTSTIKSLPYDDHPGAELAHFDEFAADLGAGELRQLARITKAISLDETRYFLNGICVTRIDDWLYRFAATDGHRLMMVDIPMPNAVGILPDRAIMPRRWIALAIQHFGKTREAVKLNFGRVAIANKAGPELDLVPGGPRVALSGNIGGAAFTLASKLIDGTYPDYMRVVPGEARFALRFSKGELAQAIAAISALSGEKLRAIKLCLTSDKIVRLSQHCSYIGSSEMTVSATILPNPSAVNAPFEIGFNARYLLDMCEVMSSAEIEFAFIDSSAPVLISDPDDTAFKAVLMPLRF